MSQEHDGEIIERAARLLAEGRIDEAWEACRPLIEAPGADGRALLIAGIVQLRRGESKQAMETLTEAARASPSDPTVHNALGEVLRSAGNAEQAEGHLRYALHLDPTLAAAHFNLGLLMWDRGLAADAELCFRNTLLIAPDHADSLRWLARVSIEQGDPSAAVAPLEHAARLVPLDAATRIALGQALWACGDTRRALECYQAAAALDPGNGACLFQAACASFELCRAQEALAQLERAFTGHWAVETVADPVAAIGRLADIRACVDANDIARAGKSQWHRIGAAPRLISADGESELAEPLQAFSNEMFIARLAPARILPGEMVPLMPGGELFIDHVASKPLQRVYTSRFIMHTSDDGRLLLALPSRVQPEERECVLLGSAPAHREWLFECLARLWMVRQRPSLEALPLLVQPGLGRWQRELLGLLGYANDRIIEGPHDSTLLCREVHVPSLPGLGHFVAPAAVEHLRRELRAALPGEPATPRRIYVSRTGAPSRRLANEEEITALLRRHAFEIVQPGDLAAAELLGLIQGADIVIGVEGAAMAHVFFAPPRASIGMIVADGLQSTRYYGPSAVLGQKFSFLLAQADYTSHRDHGECDLMLAPPVLERFLAQLQ